MIKIGLDNPIIKDIRKKQKRNKDKDIFFVEELGILEKYISSSNWGSFGITDLFICEEICESDYAKDIFNKLEEKAKNIYSVSKKTYQNIVIKKNSAGLFAIIKQEQKLDQNFISSKYENIVIIDGLEYPGNIGTIFRTADATKTDCILIVNSKSRVNNDKVISSSRGMIFKIPFFEVDALTIYEELAKNNFTIFLCEPKNGTSITKIDFSSKTAIVLGSERFGISDIWFTIPHENLYIPMSGSMTSLNVGVAASLIMYDIFFKKNNL